MDVECSLTTKMVFLEGMRVIFFSFLPPSRVQQESQEHTAQTATENQQANTNTAEQQSKARQLTDTAATMISSAIDVTASTMDKIMNEPAGGMKRKVTYRDHKPKRVPACSYAEVAKIAAAAHRPALAVMYLLLDILD